MSIRLTMKPGRSAETMSFLPSASVSSRMAASVASVVAGAADQLDERHHRHRAEEVHPDEALAASRRDRRGERVDRDRAGVRGEDRGCGRERVELAPERLLDVDVLEHGLDDEIGVADGGQVRRRRHAAEDRVPGGLVQLSLRDRAIEVAGDPVTPGLGAREIGLVERDVLPDGGMDLADAVAHEARRRRRRLDRSTWRQPSSAGRNAQAGATPAACARLPPRRRSQAAPTAAMTPETRNVAG